MSLGIFFLFLLTEVNECASMPCVNGVCVDQRGSYACYCLPGWMGEQCDMGEC